MSNLIGLFNYYAALIFILFGLYVMMAQPNLIRKIIGMVVLQTGVILFYISVSVKKGAAIPIVDHHAHHAVDPSLYANPLPHALMLTAIVVGVSTLGVALVLAVSVFRNHQTLEEDDIVQRLKEDS